MMETITRILDVFERVFKETGYNSRWAIDHAETIKPRNIEAALRRWAAVSPVQNRLAFRKAIANTLRSATVRGPQHRFSRCGRYAGRGDSPLARERTRPRVSSLQSLAFALSGCICDRQDRRRHAASASPKSRLSRCEAALRLYTVGSAWFSGEEEVKGRIAPGQFADFAILSADYLSVPDEQINTIESVLTVTGGDIVYTAAPFAKFAPEPLPPVSPAWSPVAVFGGYQQAGRESTYA